MAASHKGQYNHSVLICFLIQISRSFVQNFISSMFALWNKMNFQTHTFLSLIVHVYQCDFRFDLFFSFSFVLVLQYFFVVVLVLPVIFYF